MVDQQLERDFLAAAAELVLRQGELLPRLELALGVDPYEYWVRRSRGQPTDSDPEGDGEWRWRFHGLEVDITHERDGRLVRVDFGPRGRRDVFSDYGIGLFVCHTRAPWREFPRLRAALDTGDGEPSFDRVHSLRSALFERGDLEHADPAMVALAEKYTTTPTSGYGVIAVRRALQRDTPEDLVLCRHLAISESGRRRLVGGP